MDLAWAATQNCSTLANYSIMEKRSDFEALPPHLHIYIILLYTGTATFALLSNLLTLLVLRSSTRTSRSLTKYLVNLSAADLLLATTIPFNYTSFMYGRWHYHPLTCPLLKGLEFCSVFVSCYTLIAIGVDRYIAIKTPLRSKTAVNMTNAILATIWLVGLSLSAAVYHIWAANEVNICGQRYFVCDVALNESQLQSFVLANSTLIYLLPVAVLMYVYSAMAMVMFRRDLSNSAALLLKRQRRKIIQILMVVVAAFILCWTPLQLFNVITSLFPSTMTFNSEAELNFYVVPFFIFHWLAMSHSCLNPIIYSFMSISFRKDFLNLFCHRKGFHSQLRTSSRNGTGATALGTIVSCAGGGSISVSTSADKPKFSSDLDTVT